MGSRAGAVMGLDGSEWAGIAIVFILIWVIPAYFVARVAQERRRSFAGFLVVSLLLGWLIPLFVIQVMRPVSPELTRKCVYCSELIKDEATFCVHCGKELDFVSLT
ncbi:hypothetical protein SAMN05216534_0696 [Candidatus Aquiluna sp. UB-MaderosW2red]|nr:hypothetical protein SAMN05216534_0696 [Candidatus Aquiluna sp. UB-MaderosW2red]